MELQLSRHTTVKDLQEHFQHWFPYLKLIIYSPDPIQGDDKPQAMSPQTLLENISGFKQEGTVSFETETTVKELEETLRHKFGLQAQVFRQSGKIWLQTSSTDHWTLVKQQEEAKASLQHLEADDPEDYHEQL